MPCKALKKKKKNSSSALVFSTPYNASSWDIFHIKNNQLIILYLIHLHKVSTAQADLSRYFLLLINSLHIGRLFTLKIYFVVSPIPTQWHLLTRLREKHFETIVGKGEIACTRNFSFSHNVFYSIKDRNYHFCYILICCLQMLSIWSGPKFFRVGMSKPFPNKPWFSRIRIASPLKTLWKKETLLVVRWFLPFLENFPLFWSNSKLSCKLFQFGHV